MYTTKVCEVLELKLKPQHGQLHYNKTGYIERLMAANEQFDFTEGSWMCSPV
jgi:hypothetical protein